MASHGEKVKIFRAHLFFWLGFVLLEMLCPARSYSANPPQSETDIEVFTRQGCPHCAAAKPFLAQLQQERPALRVLIRDVEKDPSALARLRELATQHGGQAVGVPAFYLRGTLLIGYRSANTTGQQILALLDRESSLAGTVYFPFFGQVSVGALGLPVFTLLVGLLDGFNPCAMWVLLFLLSLLVNLRDRRKMFLIGGTFVAVSGMVYFAFMAAWLNVFLLIGLSRMTQLVLGGIASLIGAINLKDFFAFGRGFSLRIPESAKPGLYARVRRILQAENLSGAFATVIVLAVLVNMIELLCTAGLPAMYTQILSLRQLPWWDYYAYLLLYNVAYMFDDSLMLTIAVVTLSHHKLQEKEGRWLKLVSGAVMLSLGIILIVTPGWLTA